MSGASDQQIARVTKPDHAPPYQTEIATAATRKAQMGSLLVSYSMSRATTMEPSPTATAKPYVANHDLTSGAYLWPFRRVAWRH